MPKYPVIIKETETYAIEEDSPEEAEAQVLIARHDPLMPIQSTIDSITVEEMK